MALLLGGLLIGYTGIGVLSVSAGEISQIIGAKVTGQAEWLKGVDPVKEAVIWKIRLPRLVTAMLVGAGLAVAGTIFQAILINPLADPYTLGVSSGAAFAASLAIYGNWQIAGMPLLSLPLFAFGGALFSLAVVYAMARINGMLSVTNLILAGVIVGSIFSAAISLLKSLSGDEVSAIVFWLMGSFASRSWPHVWLALPIVATGLAVALYYAEDLNLLSLGARTAGHLGVDEERVRTALLIIASLISAGCVAVCGIIGFVGLIVPHLMRMVIGPDNRYLIPASALFGAILLSSADTLARNLLTAEIPVGVLTTLLGGPFFIYIFRTKMKKG
ncbi:iron chelate uptake ABC transporter family permease subunit [Heliobacterium gestii]|uniref:Iron chelate uptake ABC transporter family permease subunit n=2 Tax=Heliomicrobium gestii TaxID=2699 RepID=A0A845LLW4_HELGE|nr:iron chelate uptake ABC transporter family permease subunit [Heliomicrobium gestii]